MCILFILFSGKYLIMITSLHTYHALAKLVSQSFNEMHVNGECFIFFYYISNPRGGALDIYVKSNGTVQRVWRMFNGKAWNNGQVNVRPQSAPYEVSLIMNHSLNSICFLGHVQIKTDKFWHSKNNNKNIFVITFFLYM